MRQARRPGDRVLESSVRRPWCGQCNTSKPLAAFKPIPVRPPPTHPPPRRPNPSRAHPPATPGATSRAIMILLGTVSPSVPSVPSVSNSNPNFLPSTSSVRFMRSLSLYLLVSSIAWRASFIHDLDRVLEYIVDFFVIFREFQRFFDSIFLLFEKDSKSPWHVRIMKNNVCRTCSG